MAPAARDFKRAERVGCASRADGPARGEIPTVRADARPSLLRRLLLSLASLAVCLLALELGARAVYEAPWYERLVDAQAQNVELEYRRNRFNLRGPAHDYPKPAGTRRVLVLGDSFTFGTGVAQEEAIFVRILERELTESSETDGIEAPGIERVELFNGAIIGSLTDLWCDVWDVMKDAWQPDLVLIVFFLRDGTLAGSIPEFFDDIRDGIVQRNRASLPYRLSYLLRHFRDARDRDAIRAHYTAGFRAGYFGDEQQTVEWRKAQRNLLRIRDEARVRSIGTAFVIFPVLAGLEAWEYPFQDVCDLLAGFATEAGMPVHDLLPAFRGRSGPDLWVSALDQHPNAAAHAIAAESLLPFVRRLLVGGE